MQIIKKLKEISAVKFHEIKFTGNVFLLDKDYSEEKDYNEQDVFEIGNAWEDIYDDYYKRSDDNSLKRDLNGRKKRIKLLLTINLLGAILKTLNLLKKNNENVTEYIKYKTIKSLNESLKNITKRIKISPTKNIDQNISVVEKFKKATETSYRLHHSKGVDDKKQDIMLFYEIKSKIEHLLEKNSIDEMINMLQWIAYEKQAKIKLKSVSNGKQSNKRSRGNI